MLQRPTFNYVAVGRAWNMTLLCMCFLNSNMQKMLAIDYTYYLGFFPKTKLFSFVGIFERSIK